LSSRSACDPGWQLGGELACLLAVDPLAERLQRRVHRPLGVLAHEVRLGGHQVDEGRVVHPQRQ
jgi:hypothetical protein